MLNIIFILVALAVIGMLLIAARQSGDFQVSRQLTLPAPASAIFPHINNLNKWNAWSPWAKLDPNAKNTFEGPEEGVGAKMSWAGNNKVGAGSMTVIDSQPNELIRLQLDFLKPMKATNKAEFIFQPDENQTLVAWSMSGTHALPAKLMGLIMNFDKMIGSQFEQGLASLKDVVEAEHYK